MYSTVFWTLGEEEGGMIWENGIETCIISYKKRIASPGSMQDTGSLGRRTGQLSPNLQLSGKWKAGDAVLHFVWGVWYLESQ